jgi:hypothetical protein
MKEADFPAYLSDLNERVQRTRSAIQSVVSMDSSSHRSSLPYSWRKSNLYQALLEVSEPLAFSYAQVREDLEDEERTSWAGTAHEIREMVSTLLRLLAPNHEVTAQPWYKQEPKTSGPTQKQRVRYVLQQHSAGSNRREVAEEVDIIEAKVADLVRATYSRASDAAHRMKGRTEAMRVFRYFEAFAYDLLNLD